MVVIFGIYLRDRETKKIAWFTHTKFNVEDIQQTIIDIMIDTSDYDFECIKVKLIEILSFT